MAVVLVALWLTPARGQPYPVTVRADVAYGPLAPQQGDLLFPAQPGGPRPAAVMIHGGGWTSGSRHEVEGFAKVIASMGIAVFNIDYRLADAAQPGTRWPAQLQDAQLAVRFLRAHAAEFGIDPARIGAVGDSAGGQLAVFLGVLQRVVQGDMAGLYANERPDVQAVVDLFGVMDLPGMGGDGAQSMAALFGTTGPSAQALLTASPLPLVTSHSAPMYIVHGRSDELVPFEQSRLLQDALHARGVRVELVPYDGGHAWAGLSQEAIAALQIGAEQWLVARLAP